MSAQKSSRRRLDYELIQELVPENSRVLDLGCGDGRLLAELAAHKGCRGYGIEIDDQRVLECIQRGTAVYHGDMLEGLAHYRDGSFDLVILSQTLQQTADPCHVLHEMLRVGRTAIITFPNFGYWRIRMSLLLTGRMPVSGLLPYDWYDTPNVHLCSVNDLRQLCAQEGLRIVREMFLSEESRLVGSWLCNWRSAQALFQISK